MADHTSPFLPGQKLVCKIETMGFDGQGIAKPEGFTVFIPKTIPGETVEIEITEIKRRYAFAKVLNFCETSPQRIESPCGFFSRCGGCHYQHVEDAYAEELKLQHLQDGMKRIAKTIESYQLHPMYKVQSTHYRNRITLHYDSKAKTLGYVSAYDKKIIPVDHCLIAQNSLNTLSEKIKPILDALSPGLSIPHVVLRETGSGEVAILLSITHASWREKLKLELIQSFEKILSEKEYLYACPIPEDHFASFENTCISLIGPEFLTEKVGPISYSINPTDFFQINRDVSLRMLEFALEFAKKNQAQSILDIYCGVGFFSLYLAHHGYQTYGIEVSPSSILSAQRSAKLMRLEGRTSFRAGKASKIPESIYRESRRFDTCIVDPPRKGMDIEALEYLRPLGVKNLLYVSCSPPTFARDAAILKTQGYVLKDIYPLDMFPKTYHVELMATFLYEPATQAR